MRTLEPGTAAPRGARKVGPTWWLSVGSSIIVAIPIAYVVGVFIVFGLNVPETGTWEIPPFVFAGLAAGVAAGLAGRVRGWWLAGTALVGAAMGALTSALYLRAETGHMGLAVAAWVVGTIVIAGATRFAYGRQHPA